MAMIQAYQTNWPLLFLEITFTQQSALGPSALCIDHIGSTVVPGLAGKDRINNQITVAAFDNKLFSDMLGLG
ncbi:MAG: GrpB family protein [Chloroflexota bacterium]